MPDTKTILLVEDDVILLTAQVKIIKQFGYKVIIANTGEEAVRLAIENKNISLILIDINLGKGIDGPEAIKQILSRRTIPIVFLTSHPENEYVDRVKEIPNYGYVIKNSGDFVLRSSIEMAYELFEIHAKARDREEALLRAEKIAGFGSWEFNLSTKTVTASAGARRIYGLGDREWTIEAVQTIPLPEYRSILDDALLGLIEQGLPYDVEFKALRPSDNKYINIHAIAEYDPERNVVTGTIQDITERKQAKRSLRKAEKKYHSIFENAVEGIFQTTPDGRFLTANPALAKIFGYDSPEELVCSISDTGNQLYVNPEKRVEHIGILNKKGLAKNFEAKMYRKDGSIVWVSIDTRTVRDNAGKPLYYEGFMIDITERKQMEEELKKHRHHLEQLVEERTAELMSTNNKYQILFENANDAIFLIKKDTIIDCNLKTLEVFRCTREQLIGQTPDKLSPPLQPDNSRSKKMAIEKLKAVISGIPQYFEWQHLRPDGTIFDAEVNLHPVNIGKGVFIQVMLHDISERKQAEKALKQSESELRTKSSLLEELNTALRVLLRQRGEDKDNLEDLVVSNVKRLVIPYVEKMKKGQLNPEQRSNLTILETNLNEIVSPFLHTIRQLNLTPRETQIASLIKEGRTTKEIAELIGVAASSIDSYRNSIRSKLGLISKKVNLQSCLQSFK